MTQGPLVENIHTFPQNIVEKLRQRLLALDAHLRVRPANCACYQTCHVSPDEIESHPERGGGERT